MDQNHEMELDKMNDNGEFLDFDEDQGSDNDVPVIEIPENGVIESDGMFYALDCDTTDDESPENIDDMNLEAQQKIEANTMLSSVNDLKGRFSLHTEPVYALAVSPRRTDGTKFFLTGGGDNLAYLWVQNKHPHKTSFNDSLVDISFQTTTSVGCVSGHEESVCAVAFNYDGTYCATADLNGRIIVLTVPVLEQKAVFDDIKGEIEWLKWSPKSNFFLVGESESGVIYVYSTQALQFIASMHSDCVTAGLFIDDGKRVITVSSDGSCALWSPRDVFSGKPAQIKWTSTNSGASTASTSNRSGSLCSNLGLTVGEQLTCVAVSSTNIVAAVGTSRGIVLVLSLKTGMVLAKFGVGQKKQVEPKQETRGSGINEEHDFDEKMSSVLCLDFSFCGRYLAVGGLRIENIVYDVNVARKRCVLETNDSVLSMQWVQSTRMIIVGTSEEGRVFHFDGRTGKKLRQEQVFPEGALMATSVDPDEEFVVVGGAYNGAIILGL